MSTLNICKDFFNFNGELNHGHDIISALYRLIIDCKRNDFAYFMYLDRQLFRYSKTCHDKQNFLKLVDIALVNVSHNQNQTSKLNWIVIAYMFYVADKIDEYGRKQMDCEEYEDFKDQMILQLNKRITDLYGKYLTSTVWSCFGINQNLEQISKKMKFPWFKLAIGTAIVFLIIEMV